MNAGLGGMLVSMINSRILVFVLMGSMVGLPAQADTIYRWVDANGLVHFSDVPREGAQEVELSPQSSFRMPAAASSVPSAERETVGVSLYESLAISSPTEEQTIWNTGGVINISVSPTPALRTGHGIRLYYDGQPLQEQPLRTTSMQLSEVYRGEHTLRAEIVDASGQVLIRSTPVTFFYRQTAAGN